MIDSKKKEKIESLLEDTSVNWQQKYMDEHIKVQDSESKVDIYENITIPKLKEEIKALKKMIKEIQNIVNAL